MIVIVPNEIVLANVVTDLVHYKVLTNVVDNKPLSRETYVALATLTARMGSAFISHNELENGVFQCEAYMRDIQVVKNSLHHLGLPNLLDRAVVKRSVIEFLEKIGTIQCTIHTIVCGQHKTQIQYRIDKERVEELSLDDKLFLVSLRTNHGVTDS